MPIPTLLIAESGSTKTDWCLLKNGRKNIYSTQGFNPFFMTTEQMQQILSSELPKSASKQSIDEIHFYGAGIQNEENKKQVNLVLKEFFGAKKIYTHSDILASARATCAHQKGFVCILGTGSNTCFYNGKKIGFKTESLGYVLGDEGSGNHLGKKVLQYYLHGIFDEELQEAFATKYDCDKEVVLHQIYRMPFPNRYLASFARFIMEHRGHYMIENIAEDCINDLFINHLLRYPLIHKYPVHFTGSVAWHLRDVISSLCSQYEIEVGSIIQKPITGLIDYHKYNIV